MAWLFKGLTGIAAGDRGYISQEKAAALAENSLHYQTRHTYASMMLSNGENIMWVANQMKHANVEMVIKT